MDWLRRHMSPRVLRAAGTAAQVARAGWRRIQGTPLIVGPVQQRFSLPGREVFYGYYDISPANPSCTRILAHSVPWQPGGVDPGSHRAVVGHFEIDGPRTSFKTLGMTQAWNWQQGARLRWDPRSPADQVLLNDAVSGRLVTRVLRLDGTDLDRIPAPLYDISATGTLGLTLDFGRLHRLRPGYGYPAVPDTAPDLAAPAESGLDIVNVESGERHRVLSLKEAAQLEPHPSMFGAHHYFNHASFSPDTNRFLVLHLWSRPGFRASRLMVFDTTGRLEYLDPDQTHMSHFTWEPGSGSIIAFAQPGDASGQRYWRLSLDSGTWNPVCDTLFKDGHPSVHPREPSLLLTDTYPDRWGEQRLLLHNLETGGTSEIARIFSPPWFRGEYRCDLHPRWVPDGSAVIVDSAYSGRRKMLWFDVSGFV